MFMTESNMHMLHNEKENALLHVITLCDQSDAAFDMMDDPGTSLAPRWRKVMEPVKIRIANETEEKAIQALHKSR